MKSLNITRELMVVFAMELGVKTWSVFMRETRRTVKEHVTYEHTNITTAIREVE